MGFQFLFHTRKAILFAILITSVAGLTLPTENEQDENFINVVCQAIYNRREYPDQRVTVIITQDGRPFKIPQCDAKGRLETKIYLNHLYVFNFSMDYHATSKVQIDTRVPEKIAAGDVGGVFSFDCELFERVEGLNLAILNKPLVKIAYNEEKNDFEYDKEYTEKIMINLDGFREQLATLKQRRKQVFRTEEEGRKFQDKAIAEEEVQADRKPIVFEDEKNKPAAVNKLHHRNIMDQFNDEGEEGNMEKRPVKDSLEDNIVEAGDANKGVKGIKIEDILLEEAIDESEFVSLNVIPKRIAMDEANAEDAQGEDLMKKNRMSMQQSEEKIRVQEEAKIKEEMQTMSNRAEIQKEKRLINKELQTQLLSGIIKTVALEDIKDKRTYYNLHPVEYTRVPPVIIKKEHSSWWVDTESVTVSYPNSLVRFKKEIYPMGITFYYIGGEKTDEETYCSRINQLSFSELACTDR